MFKELRLWHMLVMLVVTAAVSILVMQRGCMKSPEEKQAIEAKAEAVRVRRDNWIEQCAEKLTIHAWSECKEWGYRGHCNNWQDKTETTPYNDRIKACAETFDSAH